MARTIRLFLASSINEFADDRREVTNFIDRLNKIYRDKIFFILEKCEDTDDFIYKGGKQAQYDELIRVSDFMFLLFGKTVGSWTRHEFEVAYETFQQKNYPKIGVYIRTATDDGETVVQDELAKEFKKYLNDNVKHFWGTYAHIDTLLFKIVMNLIASSLSVVNISVVGDALKDGNENILSLTNVPAWSENDALIQADDKFKQLQDKYNRLHAEWLDDEHSETVDKGISSTKCVFSRFGLYPI